MTKAGMGIPMALAVTLSCAGGDHSSRTDTRAASTDHVETSQQNIARACGGADSLIFSNVVSDSETEDVSGVEITLARRGTTWSGSSREAAGEFLGRVPLIGVSGDTVPGPMSFAMPDEKDTAVFRGAIYCDSLAGEMRDFRNTPFEPVTFKRVRQ